MIRTIRGDHVTIDADENGVVIRTTGQAIHLSDEAWRELFYFCSIVSKAADDYPA